MVIRPLLLILLLLPVLAHAQGDARLMILHDHGNPVVSEMVPLTIRGEYDLTVSLEDMRFPNSPDYDWIQTARDDWHKERVNGRLLQIFERKLALFPRRDGALHIGPLTHHLTYVTATGGRERIDVTAPPVTIAVKPFPGGYRPLSASQMELTDELSAPPGQLRQHEVLTRRVTIQAVGAMAHHLPPRPDLSAPWLISFTRPEQRETRLTEAGPVARVVWEWQLRPITGEPAILPAVALPWFDTRNRHIEIAALKPIPFGFAGFGANFGAAEGTATRNAVLALAVFAGAMLAGLAVLLAGQGMASPAALRHRLRRRLPGPHLPAMRRAARAGDLPALRAAALRHLAWRGVPAPPGILDPLDRQLYAADPPAGFDAPDWLARFRAALHR